MKKLLLLLSLLLVCGALSAKDDSQNNDFEFVENVGQFADPDVIAVGQRPGEKVFVRRDGLSFVFRDAEGMYRRVDMELIGSREEIKFLLPNPTGAHHNYYKNGEAFEKVPVSGGVMLLGVYKGVNLAVYTNQDGRLEYDFAVYAGDDPSQIRYRFSNAEGVDINEDGSMTVRNSFGDITKMKPYTYYSGKIGEEIESEYVIDGDIISYKLGDYDREQTIIIDPVVLDWATYYGGSDDDLCHNIITDEDGYIYMTGETASTDLTATVNQTSVSGGRDAFLVKLNSDGTPAWSTFYGGSGDDIGRGLAVNAGGHVWLTGETQSDNLRVTVGQQSRADGRDAFLVRFDGSGNFIWGTYYGASGEDIAYGIDLTPSNYAMITGETSSDDLDVTTNQTTFGGAKDAFLAFFTPLGMRQWATYFGGSSVDVARGVGLDDSGNIYIAGRTASDDLGATVNQRNIAGDYDAFVAQFSATGATQWSTYFGGSEFDEAAALSAEGNMVVIAGRTMSDDIYTSVGQTERGSAEYSDALIAKFNSNGATVWSTLLGGLFTDYATGVIMTSGGAIYVTGHTESTDFPRNAFRTNSESDEGFVAKLSDIGRYQWGSYIGGGSDDDIAASVAVAADGDVLVAGYTNSNDIPANVNQTTIGGEIDVMLFRLKLQTGQYFTIKPPVGNPFCAGDDVVVEFETHQDFNAGNIFRLQLSDRNGSFQGATTLGSLNSTQGGTIIGTIPADAEPGDQYRMRLLTTDPIVADSNNGADLQIGAIPTGDFNGQFNGLCAGEEITYTSSGIDPADEILWTVEGGFIQGDPTSGQIVVVWEPAAAHSIELKVTNIYTGCVNLVQRNIGLRPSPAGFDNVPENVCAHSTSTFSVIKQDNVSQAWTVLGGYVTNSNSAAEVEVYWLEQGSGTITCLRKDSVSGCRRELIKIVEIDSLPPVEILEEPGNPICAGNSVTLSTEFDPDKYIIRWAAPTGEVVGPDNMDNVEVYFEEGGSHTITLYKTSLETGCTGSDFFTQVVGGLPPAEVAEDVGAVCAYSETVFHAISISQQRNFKWTVEGGEIVDFDNADRVIIQWSEPGQGRLKLVETMVATGCKDSTVYEISILEAPIAEITGGKFDVCKNSSTTYSTNAETGVLINWSVDQGTIVGRADQPVVEVLWDGSVRGEISLHKIVESGDCADSVGSRVNIKSPPDVTLSLPEEICENSNPFQMNGSPSGGRFSGPGVVGSGIFDPAAAGPGEHEIEYKYTDTRGCTGSATDIIMVLDAPDKPEITREGDLLVSSAEFNNQWYFEGEPLPGATADRIAPKQDGIYQVIVTADNGCEAVSDEYNFTLGVIEIDAAGDIFEVFPNPAGDRVNIRINRTFAAGLDICLTDLTGRTMDCIKRSAAAEGETLALSTSGAGSGVYLLRIMSGADVYFMKIIIAK